MAKVKILSPNKKYTGESAGVRFVNGEGYTDDKHRIDWFKSKGYTVEAVKAKDVPQDEEPKDEAKDVPKETEKKQTTAKK